jgi:hypothetical protein
MKVEKFMEDNPLSALFLKRDRCRLPYSVFKPHSEVTTFLESIFKDRPPTAFFQYPPYVKLERKCNRILQMSRDECESYFMSFKISETTHIYNAVVNSCKTAGFNMIDAWNSDMFNLQWTGYIMPPDIENLNKY